MIDGLFSGGAMPVLERLVEFTDARQRVLAHDIANLSTPYFKPTDMDPGAFQQNLRDALDRRRSSPDSDAAPLETGSAPSILGTPGSPGGDDDDSSSASSDNQGILFHDQNNRDLERIMQHLAENTLAHSAGVELLRSEFSTMKMAIQEHI